MPAPLKPLKWYKELATKKGRLEAGAFLVEGDRAIRQITGRHPEAVTEVLTTEAPPPAYGNYPVRLITESQCLYICHTRTPQGTMAVVHLPADTCSDTLPDNAGDRVLLLEDIQDPGNVGTLIRTAAAFGFAGVIMTEKCADPLSPKCVQATVGAVLSVWLRRTARYLELAGRLQEAGYPLIATDLNGDAGTEILGSRRKILLALGNEAAGLSREVRDMADYRLRLPIARDKAESLNVAACGAILMYLSSQI